jgi:hypothetical protein
MKYVKAFLRGLLFAYISMGALPFLFAQMIEELLNGL